MKLWSGRFTKDLKEEALEYTKTTGIDERMILEDIWGSEVHAIMLAKKKIINDGDLREILFWLEKAKKDYLEGRFKLNPEFEDVHLNVESYINRGAGTEVGGKFHTARSRNDQVLADFKLYLRKQILETQELILQLQENLLKLAEKNTETIMPGYTHMQHAQPITFGFWLTGYASALSRDVHRLGESYVRVNSSPLGACALSGTSLPIDRELTSTLLGFDSIHEHALDAVSSRDFALEVLADLSIIMSTLSKFAEEIVLWSSSEFKMLELDDSYTTGSSIMPQKKNPDVAELVRGRTGRVYGYLFWLMTVVKGLPSGYNRDLQEDKPPLWYSLDVVKSTVSVLNGMVRTMKIRKDRMAELSKKDYTNATELANYLVVKQKIPFRRAHEIVGKLVLKLASSGEDGLDLSEIHMTLKKSGVSVPINDLKNLVDIKKVVEAQTSLGGTSSSEVYRMIRKSRKENSEQENLIKERIARIEDAEKQTQRIIESVVHAGKKIKRL